ncbi:MAG: HlyD family efflux transporter periplasmic adaptor subunit [Pirellulaceae bacterium]|nr:HlyD family efflux transporter periplasmic adaptor subunit [Pirellulaceae bacterium]
MASSAILQVVTILALPPERSSAARPPSAFRGASVGSPQESAGAVQIPDCFIYLLEDVQVPALEAGAIKELTVTEGAIVRKGEPLAILDDREPLVRKLKAELERDAALTKASDDVEIRFAQASLAYSTAELNRLLSIERKTQNTVSGTELEKAKLARQRDELQIEKAKLDLKVAKMTADVHQAEVDAAEIALARRQIVSPVDGEVVTVFHERQEWVSSGEPVVQVVRMDRLRVEGFVLSSEVNVSEIASGNVMVDVQLARGRKERFAGKVVFISPIVTSGGKYRVRAEVENRREQNQWLLRPGMNALMTVGR